MIGTTLSQFKITAKLGEGGMGEVYRAEDTKLGRDVAIKVLPESVAADPDRRARFEREARMVSALSHPHICTLHEIGEHEGLLYLVMEHLEGDTLAARLGKGHLPPSQVLRFGAEIAAALAHAHREGVVHRDLKPGNVMLTGSGAKLLDFGLAKETEEPQPGPLHSELATENHPLTEEGTLLGTYPYMAPEQLEGKPADARSDIFALGAVLHEMATGRQAFSGENRANLISAILQSDPPPVSSLQPLAPPALDHVVSTCLAKDPEDRWQDARDVASQLRWLGQSSSDRASTIARSKRRLPRLLLATGGGVLALLALAGGWNWIQNRPEPAPVVSSSIVLPIPLTQLRREAPVISPDGTRLAYVASGDAGQAQLWIRPLDRNQPRLLAGTEGVRWPFWSPDSRHLAFFAAGQLKRVDIERESVVKICDAPFGRGGTWSSDDVIVFTPRSQSGLLRVDATGGAPEPLTTTQDETATHRWPRFLPDGRRLLFVIANDRSSPTGAYLTDLDGAAPRLVLEEASEARLAGDLLLFHRDGNIMGQRFDQKTAEVVGPPVVVAQRVDFVDGRWELLASATERFLVFRETLRPLAHLTWLDSNGSTLGTIGEPDGYRSLAISPDSERALVSIETEEGKSQIWMIELGTGSRSRFTLRPEVYQASWSPNGLEAAFISFSKGGLQLIVAQTDGAGEERMVLASRAFMNNVSWSPDSQFFVYNTMIQETGLDIHLVAADGSSEPSPIVATEAHEGSPRISPDGRWLSYTSDESGRPEVYVVSFPEAGAKRQLSSVGGYDAQWTADGSSLLFLGLDGKLWEALRRGEGDSIQIGTPRALLGGRIIDDTTLDSGLGAAFKGGFTGDMERALVIIMEDPGPATFTLVQNWQEGLEP